MSIPNVICVRDISLAGVESEDVVGGINAAWLPDIASPLIVSEAQAREVGRVAIDGASNHRHIRSLETISRDAATLQPGDVITISCAAINMTAKKCRVVGVQTRASRRDAEDITYQVTVDYYEPA